MSDALGTACTESGSAQGSCPAGYMCIEFQGESAAWCTKQCTGNSDTSCATGYTGPGFAACFIQATISSGSGSGSGSGSSTTIDVCGVICAETGSNQICPTAGECDGMCPGPLKCTQSVTGTGGSAIGSACF